MRTSYHIPKELKDEMDKLPDINWPEVFRIGLISKLDKLESLKNKGLL